ncbi:MAG: RND family efflux transporter MFP subunit [bacterium]|jgi:RND family efflux transporter MFP subunit
MWKLGSLALVVGLAVFMWFRMNPAQPTDAPQSLTLQAVANTDSANQAAGGRTKPAQTGDGEGRPTTGNGSGKPAQTTGGSGRSSPAGSGKPGGRPPALVVTSTVTTALINDRLKAIGSGTAVASVSVVPLSSGILTEVLVTAGQRVQSGDILALLENESELIARDRASRAATDAATDAARLTKLYQSNTSTEVELNRAKASLADAELGLREAELKLTRRTVTAPISGMVGLIPVDKGNYVTTQTELITIDDRSTIIVEFWIPETFANQISLNQPIDAIALADPGKTYKGTVSGIGSRIETDSRTLPVQARLDNSSDRLRPGMSFELTLKFAGQEYPAIDPLSVQWDSNGSYIWRVVEGKVQRVSVTIIQRNPESVLVNADIATGESIVREGLISLRPGASVRTGNGRP